ncbi:hypothetical protein A5714_14250 [Mycobacterium sp. E2462]|nr:hypothetical protein A5714_14250 [Mycobacterium sp. E2462]
MSSDQLNATDRSRRPRLTDSSCISVSRHRCSPASAGRPRTELTHDRTRQPIPSISSGRDATACASSSSATKPPSGEAPAGLPGSAGRPPAAPWACCIMPSACDGEIGSLHCSERLLSGCAIEVMSPATFGLASK